MTYMIEYYVDTGTDYTEPTEVYPWQGHMDDAIYYARNSAQVKSNRELAEVKVIVRWAGLAVMLDYFQPLNMSRYLYSLRAQQCCG